MTICQKKIIKLLIEQCTAQRKMIEILKEKDELNYKMKKVIAKELAKIDVHFHGLNDEEFKQYQEKKYLR